MRHFFLVFLILFLLPCTGQLNAQTKKKIPYYELDIHRGLFFQPNTIDPYTGTAFEEFADGRKKMQVPIKDGKIHGIVREWAVNGKKISESEYTMGQQVGVEKQWYANGANQLEVSYQNGVAEGLCREWFKNGQLRSEGLFRQGKEQGVHNWWYANGQLDQQLTYVDGKAEGLVTNYYETGQLKLESYFKAGRRNGLTKRWFANGQQHSETTFIADKEDGKSNTWSKSGLLEGVIIYDQGKIVEEFNYRSGSMFLGRSYLQIFNEKESFFTIEIKGNSVSPRWTTGAVDYSVDGFPIQLFNYPISNFTDDTAEPLNEEELLAKYLESEVEVLNEKYQTELSISSNLRHTARGKAYLQWSFSAPESYPQRTGMVKISELYFVSAICNHQVLNIRSMIWEDDATGAVNPILQAIIETLNVSQERINLNGLASRYLESD